MTQTSGTAQRFECRDPQGAWELDVAEEAFQARKRSGRPQPLGRSDNLGYVRCWECDPTGSGEVIWSDTVEPSDVCELCHDPLFLRWKAPA